MALICVKHIFKLIMATYGSFLCVQGSEPRLQLAAWKVDKSIDFHAYGTVNFLVGAFF